MPGPSACGVSPSVNAATRPSRSAHPPDSFIGTVRAAEPPQAVAAKVEDRRSAPLWRPGGEDAVIILDAGGGPIQCGITT
jgi:hypothetical protein